MANKSKTTGLSKCTGDILDDTGQLNHENNENAMYISNGGIMNGTPEDNPQVWPANTTPENNDNKRLSHNNVERKRKEKIKKWIVHIGSLLPPLPHTTEKVSTIETMERAARYITEIKEKNELLLLDKIDQVQADEMAKLKKELEEVKVERDNYAQIIKHNGLLVDSQWKAARLQTSAGLPNGEVLESLSPKDDDKTKGKSKRKNVVSSQLEAKKAEEAAQSLGNMFQGMFSGVQNQNMMVNSPFPNGNQVLMTPNGQVVVPMNQLTNNQNLMMDKSPSGLGLLQMAMQDAGISEFSRQPSPDNTSASRDLTTTSSAMDDPNHALQTLASVASNPQNAVLTSVPSSQPNLSKTTTAQSLTTVDSHMDVTSSMTINSSAQENLTVTSSVNAMTVPGSVPNGANIGQIPHSVNSASSVTAVTSSAPPIMSVGQSGVPQIPNQGNMMVNMGMNPNQNIIMPNMPNMGLGNMFMNPQGQLFMLNEQGVPVMVTNVVPPDQQQNMTVQKGGKKDKNGKKGPAGQQPGPVINNNLQEQMNMTVMTSQGPVNIIQPQQNPMNMMPQNAMLQPNMMQTLPMQGQQQVSLPGNQNVFQQQFVQMPTNNGVANQNSGIILPANQNGNMLTLNAMQNQQNQLPSALILPNGQVIPVVQNAQTLMNSQPNVVTNNTSVQMPLQQGGMVVQPNGVLGNMPNMDMNNQMLLGPQGFPIGSQAQMQQANMMFPDQLNSQQPQQAITTSAPTMSNTVMATSATQSIMTPQIQTSGAPKIDGSVQQTTDATVLPRNPVQAGVRAVVPDQKGLGNPQAPPPALNPGVGAPGPAVGPNGSILLTLPIDGQLMSVLVDPVTMQVLGRVPPTQPNTTTPATQASLTTATTTTTAASIPAAKKSAGKKKIVPKQAAAKKSKTKSSPLPESLAETQTPAVSETEMMVTECAQETTAAGTESDILEHGLSAEDSVAMTDILAKAAEEVVGFYNPANEDNPLRIDTSAGDTEDDGSASPQKSLKTPDSTPKGKADDITSINMDSILKSPDDTLSINIPTEEEVQQAAAACETPPSKKSKQKSQKSPQEDSLDTPKLNKKSSKKKKRQEAMSDDNSALHTPTLNGPVFDIPEEITFSESQLSDVLDRVEKLDSSFAETPPKKASKKKSKSEDADLPASKKRKKSGKDKGSAGQNLPDLVTPVSQPAESRMSIYDFQDDSPPELSPVRKSVVGSLNTSKSNSENQKGSKDTNSISHNFDILDSVLSQTLNMKSDNNNKSTKSPRTKSKSSKKKKSKEAKEQEEEPASLEKIPLSPTPEQQALAIEQSLDNLLQSQNVDLSQPNDIVPTSMVKMLEPLEEMTPVTTSAPTVLKDPTPPPVSVPCSFPEPVKSVPEPEPSLPPPPPPNKTPVQTQKDEVVSKPPAGPSRHQMEPPPLTHQPQRNDHHKHKTPPYQSPSQSQNSSKPSPSPHAMHPSPQHQSSNQSQTTVPLSHMPTNQRQSTMVQSQDGFSQHKSPAHHSPAHSLRSPNTMNMRNSLEQPNQSIVSPPNVTLGTSSRDMNPPNRSNQSTDIISPPNVTMGTMQDGLNQDQSIVSPPNINLGNNRGGHGFGPMNNMPRVPDASPIFPPPELPCTNNEPLFPSPIASIPKLSHIETSPVKPPSRNSSGSNSDAPSQRSRNSIYSADNFVQSSPSRSNDGRQSQDNSQLSNCYGRPQPDSSESFNFTSIGMNLTSTTHSNSIADGMSSSTTPFSFSLTSASSVVSSSSSSVNNPGLPSHGHNPFYPSLPLQPPGQSNNSQDNQNPHQGPTMNMLGVDLRNGRPHSRQMSNGPPNQNMFNFGMTDMSDCASRESVLPPRLNIPNMDKPSHPEFRNNNNNNKRIPDLTPSRSMTSGPMDHNPSSRSQVNSASSYFPPTNFNQPPSSLTTPPLRHPPVQSNERSRLTHQPPFDQNFQPRGPGLSTSASFGANRFENNTNNTVPRPSSSVHYDSSSNLNQNNMRKSTSSQQQKPNKQSQQQTSGSGSSQNHQMPSQNTSSQNNPLSHRDMPSAPSQHARPKSQSRKQSSKKSKPQVFNPEMDTNLAHSIFDSNQGMPPYFSVPNLSPNPNRNLQGDGPSFLHSNLFGGSRPNTGPGPKNSDIGVSFNPLFNPSRPQNSIPGLNFQPGFGMNHVSASSAPQITPHSGNVAMAPHLMSNFGLSNIFSDVNNSQSDSLNISPIKFPHGNHMLQQHGMDPNSLQHHHQNSALYHNRGHPGQQLHNAMAINSLLGHNAHGFDVRPMGQGINSGPPFHGPGHPGSFGMPPLNFSLHDNH